MATGVRRARASLRAGRAAARVAGKATLFLLLLGAIGLILALAGRAPGLSAFGIALVVAGTAEAAAGSMVRLRASASMLILAGGATLVAGFVLAVQGNGDLRQYSELFLRWPSYVVITIWLLARSVALTGLCLVWPGADLKFWVGAAGTVGLFLVLIVKIPLVALIATMAAAIGYSRDVLPALAAIASLALLFAAAPLAGIARSRRPETP